MQISNTYLTNEKERRVLCLFKSVCIFLFVFYFFVHFGEKLLDALYLSLKTDAELSSRGCESWRFPQLKSKGWYRAGLLGAPGCAKDFWFYNTTIWAQSWIYSLKKKAF